MRRLIDFLVRNWTLKLAALGLAVLLWTVVKAEEPTRVAIPNIPIEVVMRDPGWALAAPPAPTTATVVFTGPVRELVRLAVERPRVIVPVEEVEDSMEIRPLRTGWVQLDGDLTRTRVEDVRPGSVLLVFERLTTRLIPVATRVGGRLPPGIQLTGAIQADPPEVRVSGPAQRLETLDSIPLLPIDLSNVIGPQTVTVAVDTTGLEGLVISPRSVDLFIPAIPIDTTGHARDSIVVGAHQQWKVFR